MYKGQIYDNTSMYKIFADNPYLGLTFADNGKAVIDCNNAIREITIPEGVTYVSGLKAAQIDAIHFPSTLTELGCIEGIKELIVPDTVTVLYSNGINTAIPGSPKPTIETLVIGNGVTEIPEDFFFQYETLKNLTLGKNIKTIGKSAFFGCTNLENIVIPASVKEIGTVAFSGCSGLKTVTIEGNVETIGGSAFSYCSALENISLPDSLISLGEGAFNNCKSLEKIVIPDGVTEIMEGTFNDCENLKDVTIGSGVKRIGINNIGGYGSAFGNCKSLEYIYIPDNVEIIFRDAFGDPYRSCYPKKISVPKDIKIVSGWGDKSSFYYNQCEIEMRNPGASPAQTTANNDTSAPVVQTNTNSDVFDFAESVINKGVEESTSIVKKRYSNVNFSDTHEFSLSSMAGEQYDYFFGNQFDDLGVTWDYGSLSYDKRSTGDVCYGIDLNYGRNEDYNIGSDHTLNDCTKVYDVVVNNLKNSYGDADYTASVDYMDNYSWTKNNIELSVMYFHFSNSIPYIWLSIKKYSITDQDVDYQSLASGNRTKDGELCAVNLLGKTVSSVEKEYGVKLSLTEYGYCAETFPYTLGALEYNGEAYITTVSVYRNGKLNPDISCGIKYNDLITYCKSNNYEYFLWDDDFYYYGACVTIVMETSCAATFVWDGEMTENLESNNPPCTRIDYYYKEYDGG